MDDFSYCLIDSGDQRKLERFGKVVISRPCGVAVWERLHSQEVWEAADGCFRREPRNCWCWREGVPREWVVEIRGLCFKLVPTDFGHVGVFPEHSDCWGWIENILREANRCSDRRRPVSVLNLFAYSGGATLAAARKGARVCHVDASRGMVEWARENAALNDMDRASIRWIVDDARKFLLRELRRGNRYDGIILDPPSFGRGKKGEVFKVETDVVEILRLCRQLLSDKPLFVLVSCHTPGFTPLAMRVLLARAMIGIDGCIEQGELLLGKNGTSDLVPSGSFARWFAHIRRARGRGK